MKNQNLLEQLDFEIVKWRGGDAVGAILTLESNYYNEMSKEQNSKFQLLIWWKFQWNIWWKF